MNIGPLPLEIESLQDLKENAVEAYELKEFNRATDILIKILSIDPGEYFAYILLADIALIIGEYQQALNYLYYAKSLPDLTNDDYFSIDQKILKTHAEILFDKALTVQESDNEDEQPRRYINEALQLDPWHERANIYFAMLIANDGSYLQAIDRLLRLLERNNLKNKALIQLTISNFYREINDYVNSYLYLDMVVENIENNKDPYLYYRLAEQSFRNGNYSEATDYLNCYEKLILKEDDNQRALSKIIIARIGILKADGNIKQVLLDGHKYLKDINNGKDRLNMLVGLSYADTFDEEDDINGLLSFVEIIEKEKPEENEVFRFDQIYLGLVEEKRGNYPKALYHYREVKKHVKLKCKEHEINFNEMWQELSELQESLSDFTIKTEDPPLALYIDEKIEEYSKMTSSGFEQK